MSLEKIVRPFQSPIPGPRYIPPEQPATEGVDAEKLPTITVIGKVDSAYTEAPPPLVYSFTTEYRENRARRETDIKRVENPEDPSQYIDIERIKSATFQNIATGEELRLTMDFSGDD